MVTYRCHSEIEKYKKIVKKTRETLFKMKVKMKRETVFKMKVKTKRETQYFYIFQFSLWHLYATIHHLQNSMSEL